MYIPRGILKQTSQTEIEGRRTKIVECEKCAARFSYAMKRKGWGYAEGAIWSSGVSEKSSANAQKDLEDKLKNDSDMVPCPTCGWYQPKMVSDFHWRVLTQGAVWMGCAVFLTFIVVLIWADMAEKGKTAIPAPWWVLGLEVAAIVLIFAVVWLPFRLFYSPNRVPVRLFVIPPHKLITPGRIGGGASLSMQAAASTPEPSVSALDLFTPGEPEADNGGLIAIDDDADAASGLIPLDEAPAEPAPAKPRDTRTASPPAGKSPTGSPVSRPPSAVKPAAPKPAVSKPAAKAAPAGTDKLPIACAQCGAQYMLPANLAGKKVRCKHCSTVFVAQAGAAPSPSKPPAQPKPRPATDDDGPLSMNF